MMKIKYLWMNHLTPLRLIISLIGLLSMAACSTLGFLHSKPQYAYVTNAGSSNVSAYRINATTGALTPVPGSPFAAGLRPSSVAANPAGTFVYVTSANDDTVTAYSINATTGALTQVPGGSSPTEGAPNSVTINSAGTFAYVANETSNNVSVYSINAANGSLTPIPGSPFGTGEPPNLTVGIGFASGPFPYAVAVNPAGTFAYVANYGSSSISAYRINAATGALTPVVGSPFHAGLLPDSFAVSPAGTFAYVTNYNDGNVAAYRINATTGALTSVSGSPFAANAPTSVTVNPASTFAYVANDFQYSTTYYDCGSAGVSGVCSSINVYKINAVTGALTALPGRPVSAGVQPSGVTVSSAGRFVYVANYGSHSISAYRINAATGALTPVTGSPFPAGLGPTSIAVAQPR